jgi:hypothetical protein
VHVVFSTLVFSSLLYVGPKDALSIVGRYIAGVVVCRIILMYELAGLGQKLLTIDGEKGKEETDEDKDENSGGGGSENESERINYDSVWCCRH